MTAVVSLGLGWNLALGLAFLLGAVLLGLFTARRSPKIFALARNLPLLPDASPLGNAGPFIGRERELEEFRRAITDPGEGRLALGRRRPGDDARKDASAGQTASLMLVSGEPGIGKRALLQRFERLCAEVRRPARCGPVVDLREPRRIPDVLQEIAERLVEQQPGSFVQFERALDRYRRVARGQRTRGQEGLELTRELVSAAASVVPGGERTANAIGSTAAEGVVERWEGGSDMTSLAEAFAQDLGELAGKEPRQRVVLLFADLDSRPNDREVIWLRNWFPKLAMRGSVLIVASVASGDLDAPAFAGLERLGQPAQMRLERFSEEESRRFVADVIGLPADSPLADAIVARSCGILDRLQGYRRLIERNPHVRESERLPDDADAWASGGLSYSLLRDLPSRFLEQVVVTASPLRWFNASLLEGVAEAAKLEPGEDEQGVRAGDLIRWGTRPSWIVSRGNGWGIEDPEHRRALVTEFRRLDPNLYRTVHRLAADYHRRGLLGDQAAEGDGDAANPYALELPRDAFDDAEYVATLAEALYHLLALDPERAFPLVVRKGVEALFDTPEAAGQIVTIDTELHLAPRQRLYLDLLARSATALKENQQSEAIRVLEQLSRAGEPAPLVKPVVLHLLGEQYWNGDIDRATRRFEAADELFAQSPLADDKVAIRMRCWNATWLSFGLANRDGVERKALQRLEEASTLAHDLGDAALVAELARVRGLVQRQVGDRAAARKSCDVALEQFKAAGKPDSVALVRRNRAYLDLDELKYDEADRELELASGLYSFLADFRSRAEVEVERAELELFQGEDDRAEEHIAVARRLRPADAELENLIGNAYFNTAYYGDARQRFERSIERYREALKTAPDATVYKRNLAHALFRVEQNEEADRIFEELLKVDPDDGLTIRLYAESRRLHGERDAADKLFNRLKSRKRRERDADPFRAGASWALGDLLYDWAGALDGADAKRAYREAEKAFAKACELDPDEPGYALRRGQALLALDQLDLAVTVLRGAAEQMPGRDGTRAELARAIKGLLPVDRALAELRAALARFPGDAALLEAYGEIVSTLDPDRGIVEVERELAQFPDEPELHFLRAKLLRAHRRAPERRADRFESFVPAQSLGAEQRATPRPTERATASHETNVLTALRRATELGAKRTVDVQLNYLLELADFQIENRNWDEARRSAREAADLDPANERVEEMLRRIRFGDSWARKVENPQPSVVPLEVEVSADLLHYVEIPGAERLYNEMFPKMRERLNERWGIQFPSVSVRPGYDLPPQTVAVYVREIPRYSFTVYPRCLAAATPEELQTAGVTGDPAVRPWDGGAATWIDERDAPRLADAGIPFWDPRGVILSTVGAVLERHAPEFVTLQQVARLTHAAADGDGQRLEERLSVLADLVRQLLARGISPAEFVPADGDGDAADGAPDLDRLEGRIRSRLRSRGGVAAG